MTKLEQIDRWIPLATGNQVAMIRTVDGQVLNRDEALAAAAIDIREAKEQAYRQGVDDGKILSILPTVDSYSEQAKRYWKKYKIGALTSVLALTRSAVSFRNEAFHGARGIARVTIRQRLERIGKGNGNG